MELDDAMICQHKIADFQFCFTILLNWCDGWIPNGIVTFDNSDIILKWLIFLLLTFLFFLDLSKLPAFRMFL